MGSRRFGRLRLVSGALAAALVTGVLTLGGSSQPVAAAIDPDQLRPPVAPTSQLATILTVSKRLLTVDVANPSSIVADRTVTGLLADEVIVGMDVRAATGVLYAVAVDSLDVGRIYTIDTTTGVATRGASIKTSAGDPLPLSGTSFGVDFDPTADRLRIVSDNDQNLRVNPVDGTATEDTAVAYAAGDTNAGTNPTVDGTGYLNPFAGARSTTLYGIDSALDVLVRQDPPNSGKLTTVGPLGTDVSASNGFDIASSDRGYLISGRPSTGTGDGSGDMGPKNLLGVDLATGATTTLGALPAIAGEVVGLALSNPGYRTPGAGPVIALGADGTLLQVDGPGNRLVSASTSVTGLAAGDVLVGVDFRPANGQLYGLGRLGNLYVLDVASGVANLVNRGGTFSVPLSGTGFGFDFDPVADRIRVTSNTGQNLRLDPNTGEITSQDTPAAYKAGDANTGPGALAGAAYTNDVAGATSTALFVIDSAKSVVALQDPPNSGTLTTVGPLGYTVATPDVGFDIVPGTNRALATFETASSATPNDTDGLYAIDLSVGAAHLIGRLPVDVVDLAVPGDGPTGRGYHLVASDGGVFSYGTAAFAGSTGGMSLQKPVVGMAERPVGTGYWLVASDGGVFSFGSAQFWGSTGDRTLNQPIVGLSPHPSGQGYWLVAADGGVFSFGLARFFGSTGALTLQKPIVAMAPTPTGEGYWLFASDGGVFSYGDAAFYGSLGDKVLNKPIVGAAAAPNGQGYLLVASDGGIFAFGPGAPFKGSTGGLRLNSPIVGLTADPDGSGYVIGAADGGVFAFDAAFAGSAGNLALKRPIVGMAFR